MKNYNNYITIPNIMTLARIICAVGLIFVQPMSTAFLVLYLICGLSDALDGMVARLTNTASSFGAKLDSVADLMFYSIMIIRFFPVLLKTVSGHIWFAIILIVIIRVAIYLFYALKHHVLVSNHTYLNKITGFMVFCLPFVLETPMFEVYRVVVCVVAFVAALYELYVCCKNVGHQVS